MVFMFIVAMVAAMVVGTLMWRGLSRQDGQPPARPARPHTVAPDDDPEFLRRLGDRLRSEGEDPPVGR
jgi:hypothetical protein